ncbi:acyltransferase family protein [Phycisphaera mikurensis]|uniref:Acyltransferase 3 domain-containing protein n=1 Tax=Phycisphaera mikurensis (strain NBRC 102666 / KCTC 22515 / FYK2301M01) TaxID=1142394 RepID=I0IEC5_PHYMF|nr:acyltransferase [Phycisphaera mikurensis]MBB6441413.1 hypothetical protein [Phycisphaera mikurensis]BAM03613.1 hypothetical protein PSMK_14540 [Phycisphaera mikurensis NBRC 102666]
MVEIDPRVQRRTLSGDTSRQIVVCRVVCIFFMMSVHVRPYFDASAWDVTDAMHWVGILWVDVLGRASVPALSLISGFLIAMRFGRDTAGGFVWKRFKVLCLPMLAWNLVFQGLLLLPWLLTGRPSGTHDLFFGGSAVAAVFEHLLFLYGHPTNVTLSFLRDLFVSSLIAWCALRFGSRGVLIAFVLSLLLWQTDFYGEAVLRTSIPSFVLAGVLVQRHVGHLNPPVAAAATAYASLALVTALLWAGQGERLEDMLPGSLWSMTFRGLATLCVLDAAFRLASGGGFGVLKRWEPAAYLAYLSHSVVILFGWGFFERVVGDTGGALYVAFFLAMPAFCFVAALAAIPLLDRMPAWLQVLARGKSRRRVPAPAPAPAPARPDSGRAGPTDAAMPPAGSGVSSPPTAMTP